MTRLEQLCISAVLLAALVVLPLGCGDDDDNDDKEDDCVVDPDGCEGPQGGGCHDGYELVSNGCVDSGPDSPAD